MSNFILIAWLYFVSRTLWDDDHLPALGSAIAYYLYTVLYVL